MSAAEAINILLVDDDREEYELTRDLLAEIGDARLRLEWTPSFEVGLAAIERRSHQVCLLDYALGERSGLDLIQAAVARGCAVPIILLTGRGDELIEQQALAAGASDYLVKGAVGPADLLRAIRHSIERNRAQAAVQERERQFRAVFDAALDAMLIADDRGAYLDGNQAALELLGVTADQLGRMTVLDIAPPGAAAAVQAAWDEFLRVGRAEGEFVLARPDGVLRTVEFRATAAIVPGRHLSVLRDVTERRRAERTRMLLATVVESSVDAIAAMDREGHVTYWSPSAETLYGYRAAEVIGRRPPVLPPDRMTEIDELLARLASGEPVREHETVRLRKDGSRFHALLTLSPLVQDGELIGASAIIRDISDRKQLEAQLAVADRMVSIGTLAAGVGHEINNPLFAMTANLEFLAREIEERALGAEVSESLAEARLAAERIRGIVRDLRLFSRAEDDVRAPVDLHRVLDSTVRLAWNEIRHRAQLVRSYAEVPPVEANEGRLAQVFLNLVINAAHAIVEGAADENQIRISTRVDAGGRVLVEIADTGCGMPPEVLRRAFEPFFTTKPVGLGTGLGLPICQRLLLELGGTIEIDSEPGSGTLARVALRPMALERAGTPPSRPEAPPRRRGRVLVIDDEPAVARAIVRALAAEHDVTSSNSAAQALDWLRAGERYDLILCDLMMPQMTGMELHEALSREDPAAAARMVFLTGGAFTSGARAFLDRVANERIDKPFELPTLRTLVNRRVG